MSYQSSVTIKTEVMTDTSVDTSISCQQSAVRNYLPEAIKSCMGPAKCIFTIDQLDQLLCCTSSTSICRSASPAVFQLRLRVHRHQQRSLTCQLELAGCHDDARWFWCRLLQSEVFCKTPFKIGRSMQAAVGAALL